MRVGSGVGKPLEVPFDHGFLQVAVLPELVDHSRIGFVALFFKQAVVLVPVPTLRVEQRFARVSLALRPVERFKRLMHPRPGL